MSKIGNLSFNPEACKGMSFEEFKENFAGKLSGVDIREAYTFVTGKAPEKEKPKRQPKAKEEAENLTGPQEFKGE
jgi:hypothetical protein